MPLEEMQRYWAHQKAFVSYLSRQLNLGPDRKVYLKMNQQSVQNGQLMQIGTKNPSLPSSVACQTQKTFKPDRMANFSPQDEATVLEALHQQLSNTTQEDKIHPSRIVIWMAHGSEQRSPTGVIKRAVENLRKDFKGKRVLGTKTALWCCFEWRYGALRSISSLLDRASSIALP